MGTAAEGMGMFVRSKVYRTSSQSHPRDREREREKERGKEMDREREKVGSYVNYKNQGQSQKGPSQMMEKNNSYSSIASRDGGRVSGDHGVKMGFVPPPFPMEIARRKMKEMHQ